MINRASDKSLLQYITEIHDNKSKSIALEFVNFLSENGMTFQKSGGYWENQSYWYVKYMGEIVCYILINGTGSEEKFYPFTVWTDDTDSNWYSDCNLENNVENIAKKHIDICENCGACKGGTEKQIFGKKYFNVCRTTFRFINPDTPEINCINQLVLLRKADIENIHIIDEE